MALIKEDGSIVAGANAYADAADALAFQTNRGRQAWLDATAEVQEAALVRATDYIDGRWGMLFAGGPIGDAQTLAWPRFNARYPATGNAFPEDEVPGDIVKAAILYADQIIGTGDDLAAMTELSITPDIASSNVRRKKEKVDVLEEETEYFAAGSSLRTVQPIPEADRMVRRWLVARGVRGLTLRAG